MYIVIVCVNCNGSSQVEESMLGKVVQCPLCGKPTVARTPAAVLPIAKPIESAIPQDRDAPLSLDDATPLPPRPAIIEAKPIVKPLVNKPAEPPPKRSPVRTAVYVSISLLLTLIVMSGIYLGFQYGDGLIPDGDWKDFRPPDGKCTIRMPGDPEAEDIPAQGPGELGGKRFTVKRWFERVEVSFGWMDYDAKVLNQRFGEFVMPLRDREIKRLNGTLTGESQVNYAVKERDHKREIEARFIKIDQAKGKAFLQVYFDPDPKRLRHELRTELHQKQYLVFAPIAVTGSGTWIPVQVTEQQKRLEIEPGQRIRLWFACAQGKKITSDTPWLSKFFTSFAPE